MFKKNFILDVGITNTTKQEILEYIIKGLEKNNNKYFIVTPNPEILVLASKVVGYKKILNKAEVALPDGVGVIIAGMILGISFKERITGVELLESLCSEVSEKPITVGFLGGGDRIAERTAECLLLKYPGLKVVLASSEWPESNVVLNERFKINDLRFKNKEKKIINHKSYFINRPTIDILFVAFGAPKQEMWISENLDKLPVKAMVGVGGAFDYISRKIPRAPRWVRDLGFEWFFRLLIQPWRIKRQLALLEFVFLILKQKIKKS